MGATDQPPSRGGSRRLPMAAEASSTIMPVRYLMWGLLGVPHLVLQALRQGLPMI
eukprot:COSAG06_NODE_67277_length_252_cov_0.725490_1_plen_54_part_10